MEDSSLDSSPATVHDEFIADSFYSTGWVTRTTSELCRKKRCECGGSGSCKTGLFNHYMIPLDSGLFGDEDSHMVFPVFLHSRNVDEISAEEVRCSPNNVHASYAYFMRHVVKSASEQTLVSVALNRCKSVCFSMKCRLIDMTEPSIPAGSFTISSPTEGYAYVLAHEGSVLTPLLEAICLIGVDPVVSPKGMYSVTCIGHGGRAYSTELYTTGFTFSGECGVSVLGDMRAGAEERVIRCDEGNIRAVRTAVVTLSILLTPKSFYGGKNPSTKTVQYHVHNVELE